MKKRIVLLKFFRLIVLLALIEVIPFASAGLFYTLQTNVYEDTYYAELPRKVERLEQTAGKRVVVVGGSSVAFGIDSKLVESELGIPCVNFGLYAAFGLKPMLDLSVSRLHRGDIVVIAPETTSQMYSSYCGYDYLLKAFENHPCMLIGLGTQYYPGLVSELPAYIRDVKQMKARGGANATGVYTLTSFDALGDIMYSRSENVMEKGYIEDNLPELHSGIVTEDFLSTVNEYVRAARCKGAQVYFSFCPINVLSTAGTDEAEQKAFVQALREGLDCPLLSPLSDHIMDAGFFYDSNYHLNDVGMRYNTLLLIADIQRILGNMTEVSAELPHPPVLLRENAVLASGVQDGITYDITARGAIVTGLDEAGKVMRVLRIPQTLGGAEVISAGSGVFSGSAAEEILFPSTVTQLPKRLFAGMDRLVRATLLSETLPEVGDDLLLDANPALKLFVPSKLYGTYITDYFWGAYSEYLLALE